MLSNNRFTYFFVLLLSGSLSGIAVHAKEKPQPIHIESNSLRVDDKKGISHFKGHVRFRQGNLVILADSIRTKSRNGSIDKVTIKGLPVRMNQKSDGKQPISATAKKIEYFADSEMVHLYGNALLQQGAQQFRGEHIQYNSGSQQVIANGSQPTANSNGQGRVKAVIMPRK